MKFPAPDQAVDLEPWLDEIGTRCGDIRGHDPGCTSYGVEVGGERWNVKVAYADERWQFDPARSGSTPTTYAVEANCPRFASPVLNDRGGIFAPTRRASADLHPLGRQARATTPSSATEVSAWWRGTTRTV